MKGWLEDWDNSTGGKSMGSGHLPASSTPFIDTRQMTLLES